jgi:hypothetical protein
MTSKPMSNGRPSPHEESALIEVLSFPGCASREALMERLPRLIAASAVQATVVERIVDTDDAAQSDGFWEVRLFASAALMLRPRHRAEQHLG